MIKPGGSKCRHMPSYCLRRVMDLGYLSASSRQLQVEGCSWVGVNSPALLSFHMGSAKFLGQLEKASDQAIQAVAAGSWGGYVLQS